jgi:hypothetical protein
MPMTWKSSKNFYLSPPRTCAPSTAAATGMPFQVLVPIPFGKLSVFGMLDFQGFEGGFRQVDAYNAGTQHEVGLGGEQRSGKDLQTFQPATI